jgi:single-strand DNA-binding protein
MNKVILMGRLTRDPNVRYSPRNNSQEEMAIARYTLAVDRRGAKDGQQSADFISCVAFGRDGEFAEKYLKQGTKVVVTGRIQTGSYTNRDGQKVYGLPLKRSKGGKRRGDRKRNDSNSENTGIS